KKQTTVHVTHRNVLCCAGSMSDGKEGSMENGAFFFSMFVILPTQITARIPLGTANRTRTFRDSRKDKRRKEGSPSASLPCQPATHPLLHGRGEPGPIVGIATLTNGFGLRRVGVNDRGQSAQTKASRHRHADFTDHFAGVTRNDGCSEDFIVPFPDVEFHKTIFLTVQNGAIHLLELPH